MPFVFSDLVFAIQVMGERDVAQIRLYNQDQPLVVLDVITCGRTNNPPNTLQPDAALAVGFVSQDQLTRLKVALQAVLEKLDQAEMAPAAPIG